MLTVMTFLALSRSPSVMANENIGLNTDTVLPVETIGKNISAAQIPSVDINQMAAVATIAAAAGALLGLFISQQQASKQALDEKVSKEVDAKIGNTLVNLRELEGEARRQLEELLQQLEAKKSQLTLVIEEREKTLAEIVEKSSLQAQTIEGLLQRASVVMPSIETAELMPFQLYIQAQSGVNDYEATILLSRILEHPDADSKILEVSGDLARRRLVNLSLARKLYEQAVKKDPDNISAKSEFLHLMAYSSSERAKAREEIIRLAKENPSNPTVVGNLMNFFIQVDDYKSLEEVALDLLSNSKEKSLLWRNIAVARQSLGYPDEEVEKAYDEAFRYGDNNDFANSVRPYISFLLGRGELTKALSLVHQAIFFQPSQASLHQLRGDIYKLLGQYDYAKNAYEWFKQLGDQEDELKAQRLLNDLSIIHDLGLEHLQVPSRVGQNDGKLPAIAEASELTLASNTEARADGMKQLPNDMAAQSDDVQRLEEMG